MSTSSTRGRFLMAQWQSLVPLQVKGQNAIIYRGPYCVKIPGKVPWRLCWDSLRWLPEPVPGGTGGQSQWPEQPPVLGPAWKWSEIVTDSCCSQGAACPSSSGLGRFESLGILQRETLKNPMGCVGKCQRKAGIGLPWPQRVIQVPQIVWDQLTNSPGNLEREF